MIVRLHADDLPRWGIRRCLPDTYAVLRTRPNRRGRDNQDDDQQQPQSRSPGVDERITEVVYQSCRPQWAASFPVDYEYGTKRRLFIRVVRVVNKNNNSNNSSSSSDLQEERDVVLGDAIFEIGDVLGSFNHTKVKRFPKGGVIYCRLEPIADPNHENRICRFHFAARGLVASKEGRVSLLSQFSSAPDTMFQIAKQHLSKGGQRAWSVVYRSQPVTNSFNPIWDIGELDLESLCCGEWDRPLRISVWTCGSGRSSPSFRESALGTMLGECETTWNAILHTQKIVHEGFTLQRNMEEPLQVGRLVIKAAYVVGLSSNPGESGIATESTPLTASHTDTIADQPFTINIGALPTPTEAPATFQDYMNSWKLQLAVAIDFTSSNGDPRVPGSLHDRNPISLNDYEEAMVAIGNAVTPYSPNGLLETPVWGFGCKFDDEVRHIFQCGPKPRYQGVNGILEGYREVLNDELRMSGPTCFDKVLQGAAAQAHKNQQAGVRVYTVLLIVTDGICQDIEEAKRLLHRSSTVPLSVIFVGVGREDFGAMEDLVASTPGFRQNATFVEFRRHQHDPTSLGRSALQYLPSQLVRYMQQNNVPR